MLSLRSILPVSLLLAACPAAAPPAPGPVAAAPAAPTATAAPAPPTSPPGEDWLVWYSRDGSWATRWIRVEGDEARVLAERRALLVGAGARIWRVERNDHEIEVLGCNCLFMQDDPSACKQRARLTTLGLRAFELGSEATTTIRAPMTEFTYGDLFAEQGVAVVGGADGRLLVEWIDEAYSCGAHPNYDRGVEVFDLAAGRADERALADWPARLPEPVRRTAAERIAAHVAECEADEADAMALLEVGVALAGGAPQIHWTFGSDVTYACSSYYYAKGEATSGLLPEAAPLGLGPLPPGVTRALAEIGDAAAVGWSHVQFPATERDAALARFSAAPEGPWPAAKATLVSARTPAQERLEEGRRLTRTGDHAGAIAAFDAAIELDGGLAAAYSGRGYARLMAHDLATARKDFEAALTRDEKPAFQASVLFNLGQLAEQLADPAAARAAYTRSLALRPNKTVQKALTALGPP